MEKLVYVFVNFFTHKDKLAPVEELIGTMFTPLHIVLAALLLGGVIVAAFLTPKKESVLKVVYTVLWAVLWGLEITRIIWESVAGNEVSLQIPGLLHACSIYLYAMPFAIWGKGKVRLSACGFACTLGLLGGAVNFIYPMTSLNRYSIISFVGFHSMFYHAVLIYTALTMLRSGYHRFTRVYSIWDTLLPCVFTLIVSIPANIVNYTTGQDYMFFRGKSAFLPALFGDTPEWIITIIIYALYIIVPACFYLPSYLSQRVKMRRATEA